MKRFALIGAALFCASAAHAQTAPASAPAATVPAAPIDPAKLAIATRIAAHVMPDGFYARMLDGTFSKLIGGMANQMSDVPIRDLAKMGGLSEAEAAKLSPATLRQVMDVVDPHYAERMSKLMDTMMQAMVPLFTQMEPELRKGLAEAYARRFTAEQLADVDRFFATPSGTAYASNSMTVFMDPEFMQRMQGFTPKLMQALPGIIEQVKAKMGDLPPAPDYKKLTPEQRAKIAALLDLPAPKGGV